MVLIWAQVNHYRILSSSKVNQQVSDPCFLCDVTTLKSALRGKTIINLVSHIRR